LTAFTKLETAVLEAFCRGDVRLVLREQLQDARVTSRDNSGAGFFTYFAVDRSRARLPPDCPRVLSGVSAEIEGIEYGMLFLLFNEGGYVDCLEGATYGESTERIDLTGLEALSTTVD
jgi:hypothetical protein